MPPYNAAMSLRSSRVIGLRELALFIGLASIAAAAPAGGLRYSVAVTSFENRSGWRGQFNLADTWGSMLTDSLQQTGRFIVLGEADMRGAAMGEQDLAASGRVAGGNRAPRAGNLTPAQLLVKGEIINFESGTSGGTGGVRVSGFRIGGNTGQVVASRKVNGDAKKSGLSVGFTDRNWGGDLGGFRKTNAGEAMAKAIGEAVNFMLTQIENMPWTATIVTARDDRVYINRGSREGVQTGQTFVVGEAEEIRDPDTGELLDSVLERHGMIEAIEVRDRVTICKILEGNGIDRGMTVMLPQQMPKN
jgi:curli biogenesis system outer membrane secretion channel CsgG